MAGTTGWELSKVEADQPRYSFGDLRALPPQLFGVVETMTPPQPSPTSEVSQAESIHSLGIITVQQEFEIVYERRPKDSMSLESQR